MNTNRIDDSQDVVVTQPVEPVERINREMVAEMHAQNMSLSAISAHFDVSRERIRQVVKELGLKPRLEIIAERNAMILEEAENLVPDDVLAAKYEISIAMVGLVRRQHGYSATQFRNARIAAAMEQVSKGVSVSAAAKEFDVSPGTLSARLSAAGITSRHGRWGALEHRKTLIRSLMDQGVGWSGILAKVNEVERRTIAETTLRVWIKNHMPELDLSELLDRYHEPIAS